MLETTVISGVLVSAAMLLGCAADTSTLDPTDPSPVPAEQVGTAVGLSMETPAAGEIAEETETTGEAQEALTQWQKICVLGCSTFAGAGCAAVGVSCTAGALWSFGGILIPCAYAVIAACAGAASVTTVCAIKCVGG
jgi:hypothetical protein